MPTRQDPRKELSGRTEESRARRWLSTSADLKGTWDGLSYVWKLLLKVTAGGSLLSGVILGLWRARNAEATAKAWYGFVALALILLVGLVFFIAFRIGRRAGRRSRKAALDMVVEYLLLVENLVDQLHDVLDHPESSVSVLHQMRDRIFAVLGAAFPDHSVCIAYMAAEGHDGHRCLRAADAGWIAGYKQTRKVTQKRIQIDDTTLEGRAFTEGTLQYAEDASKESGAGPLAAEEAVGSLLCVPARGMVVGADGPVGVLRVSSSEPSAFIDSDLVMVKLAGAALGVACSLLEIANAGRRADESPAKE